MSTKQAPYVAPDFALKDEMGRIVSLRDFAGQWLVLYFYPHDDTPGCTTEACSLRDAHAEIAKLGARIVGISRDDADSHEKFKEKHGLNYTLLSDPDRSAINAYGAWGKTIFGVKGVLRKTFIIDPEGRVVKVYPKVTPLGHGEQVVADLKRLQAA